MFLEVSGFWVRWVCAVCDVCDNCLVVEVVRLLARLLCGFVSFVIGVMAASLLF